MKPRILVVDDDTALAEMLTIVLRGEGFDPYVVGDGTQALTAVRETRPDLVLLDLMLPGMNGIDVCRVLRADSGVPIVMLTAKTDTVDVVLGLESGADDYIMKPFKPKELVARVRARLRRTEDEPAELLSIADIVIDVPAHKVSRGEELISLTPSSSTSWWPWRASPVRCSPARCSSSRCGVTDMQPTPAWSTCTFSVCGPRSRLIPRIPKWF
ncbi:Response regulator receiver domain-containing protein [Rhodococcus jostii]|uniref:Response regulator receiver domain-containing protein n=1 Tax=Rhodococcus jostii TaxID=132919 RepID=A0A1H5JFS2_RHOJO|nr:Response regulator receiver domain-containing protein [Rhodococcus jostii]